MCVTCEIEGLKLTAAPKDRRRNFRYEVGIANGTGSENFSASGGDPRGKGGIVPDPRPPPTGVGDWRHDALRKNLEGGPLPPAGSAFAT